MNATEKSVSTPVSDNTDTTAGISVGYSRGVLIGELLYGLLLLLYSYVITTEGCMEILSLFMIDNPGQLAKICVRVYASMIVVIFTVAIGIVKWKNDQCVRQFRKKESLIADLQEIARRFRTVHENLHLIFLRHLESIGETLKFGSADRISLYVLQGDEFFQIARHSKNPDYKKYGRLKYPLDEGLIAKTRETNEMVYVSSLPSYSAEPKKYATYMKEKYNMGKDVVDNLTMHPRFMAGLRVSSADGNEWNAVLIVESDRTCPWSKKELEPVLQRNKACIYKLICDFPESTSSIPAAGKEGL